MEIRFKAVTSGNGITAIVSLSKDTFFDQVTVDKGVVCVFAQTKTLQLWNEMGHSKDSLIRGYDIFWSSADAIEV